MNTYRFLHSHSDSYFHPFFHNCEGFVLAPEETVFRSQNSLQPIKIVPGETKKNSFSSALSFITSNMYTGDSNLITIGKNTDGNNSLYIHPNFAFTVERNGNISLLYVLGEHYDQVRRLTSYTIVVSPKFVTDTKSIWLNGLKNHLLIHMMNRRCLTIKVESDLSNYVIRPEVPKTADYQKQLTEFLRSKETIDNVRALYR